MSKRNINRKQVALYEQVREKVLELIEERNLKPHGPVPSEGELADLFNVSRMTSKLALQALADEGIVYRLPRRGTFLSEPSKKEENFTDQSIKSGKLIRPLIALVVPEIDDYTGRIISAIEGTTREHGYDIVLKQSGSNLADEEKILRELAQESKVQGIILFPNDRKICGNEVLRLKLSNFPIVIIDRVFKEIDIDSVYHDHYQGAYEITSYLVEKGHREIGFISSSIKDVTSREERYQGYIQAILKSHIPIKLNCIYLDFEWLQGRKTDIVNEALPSLENYLKGNSNLTAVFCSDDYVAAHLMYAALNRGLKVPDQLSIVGFSDIQLARFLPVPLTTVKQPVEPLGEEAVRLLMDRIATPELEVNTLKIETEITERQSVKYLELSKTLN